MISAIEIDKSELRIKFIKFIRSEKHFLINEIELIEIHFSKGRELTSKIKIIKSNQSQTFFFTYLKKQSVMVLIDKLREMNVNVILS